MKTWNKSEIAITDNQTGRTLKIIQNDKVEAVLDVPLLPLVHVSGEPVFINSAGVYVPWRAKVADRSLYPVPGALVRESLVLYRIENNKRKELIAEADYRIDAVDRIVFNSEPAENIFSDYSVLPQRVDVLAVNSASGAYRLFSGQAGMTLPVWPVISSPWEGIARIYSRFNNSRLSEKFIYPLGSREAGSVVNTYTPVKAGNRMPGELLVCRSKPTYADILPYDDYHKPLPQTPEKIRNLLHRKQNAGERVTVVFFGDSLTAGGDVSPEELLFTRRLEHFLKTSRPELDFSFYNAAIGGTDSSAGRARFEKDVMSRKPDIITVMFVLNDNNKPDEIILENHRYFIKRCRESGAELLFITPNLNTGVWMDGLDHAVSRIRRLCSEEEIPLADAYRLWKDLENFGVPYETLLANGINHPDAVAQKIFFELVRRYF